MTAGKLRTAPAGQELISETHLLLLSEQQAPQAAIESLGLQSTDIREPAYSYRALVKGNPLDWPALLRQVLSEAISIEAQDQKAEEYRAAIIRDHKLKTLVSVSPSPIEGDLRWIRSLMGRALSSDERRQLLALQAPDRSGRSAVICHCFHIQESRIQKAIDQGSTSVKALQKSLKCGTHCGSCIPDLQQLIQASEESTSALC